ncbi:YczI family protein [Bacillus sp. AK031]
MGLWLKVLKTILAILVISLSAYSLIKDNYELLPYTLFLMGIMLLVMGLTEIQDERKVIGIFSLLSSGFALFVSIYILFG